MPCGITFHVNCGKPKPVEKPSASLALSEQGIWWQPELKSKWLKYCEPTAASKKCSREGAGHAELLIHLLRKR